MANTTVQSEQIEDGSITADKLADGTIVAAELADNAVVTAAINADAVTGAKIADNAINSEHYTDGSIDTAHIADAQITVGKMAANSVDSDQYVDGSIDTVHIADLQVTTAKIANGNISTAKIADNAVTSAKIDTNIDIAGTFDVTGATTLDSTLAVAGDANFDSGTLFVDVSANKVGVGTTSPAQTLHTSGTGVQRIQVDATDNNAAGAGLYMKVLNSGSLVGNATVRVDNVGNIDFFNGTSSESQKAELSVGGDFTLNTAGKRYYIPRASDGAATGSLYSPSDSDVRLSGAGSSAGELQFEPSSGSGVAMTINSSGNVGIGTTSPSAPLHIVGDGNTGQRVHVGTSSAHQIYLGNTGGVSSVGTLSNHNFQVITNGSSRAVVDTSGNVGIGTTSPSRLLEVQLTATNASLHNNNNAAVHFGSGSGNANSDGFIQGISLGYKTSGANTYAKTALVARGLNDGAGRQSMAFLVDTAADGGSAEIGDAKLTINGTTGVVSGDLNDTSDIAFKENILDLGNTLDLVKQLQPKTFTWKNEKAERGDSVGFIAQDVKSIIPDSTVVQGTAYEKNGDEGYSINTIGLVAYLTKAIQEQQTIIEAQTTSINDLKTRIEALES